jgi:hypothetical protein
VTVTACPTCGADPRGAAQCPRCGAECAPEVELAVDVGRVLDPDAGAALDLDVPDGGLGSLPPPGPALELELAPGPRDADRERDAGLDWDAATGKDRLLLWRITRALVLAVLVWFTLSHLAFGARWVFIDNVNLVLHEAGHVLFRWAPEAVYFLGGTIGQLMWPAAFAIYFGWRRQDAFAATACVWWLLENFIGISIYVADAPIQALPLVGGDIHDWNFLLGRWDLLRSAGRIAEVLWWAGAAGMVACLALLTRFTWRPPRRADLAF